MQWTGLNELREKFLSFFESKGHMRLPSFSLIPKDDNSLLLINSGMAPMKKYFTGEVTPPSKRVTTCQKCIRTPDIERVGITARHGTFFEMLGNFSFGDYFKHEATAWAWEFCTKVLELPVDKLWVTIYQDDDEAFDIWTKEVGVAPERIVRMGKEDNFWEHGSGPCGPCSEIYFDRGEKYGCGKPDCGVGCECDRYVEFWNVVFSQFDSDGKGNYPPMEHPNIDTGMGLERLACIMQGVDNLFLVDTVQNIMKHICRIAGIQYGEDEKKDISLRVITDHIRSTTFMIGDGVMPSNEGPRLRAAPPAAPCGTPWPAAGDQPHLPGGGREHGDRRKQECLSGARRKARYDYKADPVWKRRALPKRLTRACRCLNSLIDKWTSMPACPVRMHSA